MANLHRMRAEQRQAPLIPFVGRVADVTQEAAHRQLIAAQRPVRPATDTAELGHPRIELR